MRSLLQLTNLLRGNPLLYKFILKGIDDNRHALIFGSQKINLHQSGKEFEPKAQDVMPGSADLCFLTDENVEKVLKVFQDARMEV
jgi:hypothetical protein